MMETFKQERENAFKNIKLADHMLTQTYNLVGDAKLLLVVLDNVHKALDNIVSMVVYYGRENKEIPPFHNSSEEKFNVFKLKMAEKYNIQPDFIKFVSSIRELLRLRKESPVEFSKKDVFVICSDKFDLKKLSAQDMKKIVEKAKFYIKDIDEKISNARINR